MKATQQLYPAGQSLWLDNITRDLLTSGTLERYIGELSVTGLTSYDTAIRERSRSGIAGESLFFEIALEDITRAADLFRQVHERTSGVDEGAASFVASWNELLGVIASKNASLAKAS
jgi:transaldolase